MQKIISRLVSGLRLRVLLLLLLACAPLVGLTLHTASAERGRLVKDWNQRSQEMMELATREEGQVILRYGYGVNALRDGQKGAHSVGVRYQHNFEQRKHRHAKAKRTVNAD